MFGSVRFNRCLLGLFLLIGLVVMPVSADYHAGEEEEMTSSVMVSDQVVTNGAVVIEKAVMTEPGFVVIHTDNGGSPGPVIGHRALATGHNNNVSVPVDAAGATPVLYAMLHVDTGEAGVYEFGQVEGADGPVIVDGAPVTPSFNVAVLNVQDQIVDGSYTAASVTVADAGWLVIHSDGDGGPGPVLGFAAVEGGTTADVTVELNADGMTDLLWPMLHVDTGEAGTYEFGTVEGADGPIRLGERVAVTQVWTVPHIRMDPQIVMHGDSMEMADAPVAVAKSVLSDGAGWLVIHSAGDGGPGPVLGFAAVEDGVNANVAVELDAEGLTSVLWPMLHTDTGEAGVYEFGQVEGADGPVRVGDSVVVFPVDAAPSIQYEGVHVDMGAIVVNQALIDAPGWLVIHADNGGSPGPVLGKAPLVKGLNTHIVVEIEGDIPATVFPMLHYDTGEAGVYEFGTVEAADGPVVAGGAPVTGPADVSEGM